MKKIFLSLLIILSCTIQSVKAWDYFTIYFHDGTKSEKFYNADVDSICYSKLDVDSVLHSEWQVQEIWAFDSIYRYPLDQIDSISFTKVNIDDLAHKFANTSNTIIPLYLECNSPIELFEKLSTIPNIDGVEKIWADKKSLYVQIQDMEPITFYYPPSIKSSISDSLLANTTPSLRSISRRLALEDHQSINNPKACIVNTVYFDDRFHKKCDSVTNLLCINFEKMGIIPNVIDRESPTLDFYDKDMFSYNLLFIITHGEYDSIYSHKHWLFTGEQLHTSIGFKDQDSVGTTKIDRVTAMGIFKKKNEGRYRGGMRNISYSWIKELRNGIWYAVFYTTISEDFIKYASGRFENNAIVLTTACEALMGNDNLGKIFYGKGASCFLGYTDSNRIGHLGGCYFFSNLMNGMCTNSAYKYVPQGARSEDYYEYSYYEDSLSQQEIGVITTDSLYSNGFYLFDEDKKEYYFKLNRGYHPRLKMIPESATTCITKPQTIEILTGDSSLFLQGQMKMLNTLGIVDSLKYGFQYSKNTDMTQAEGIEAEKNKCNYNKTMHYMYWNATLDKIKLDPNTTYYYRAYMNDGFSKCYGDIKQFTTGILDNCEAYTVLANDTITFYYDDKCKKRQGHICNRTSNGERFLRLDYNKGWLYNIKTAKFDPSFANYYATNMSGCFAYCTSMTEIIDIKYLKTDSVTDMREMFYNCRSLKNLDLSHFNTSKVKDMSQMFSVCWSLNSLDLSSFNTSNVTNMSLMFYECRALVNLDLSSFNTTKVTNMYMMFEYCNSLIYLDLSSFNPINVTDMGYMFHECTSLTSLDLGHFDASNVKNMQMMFYGCSSLKDLNFSCFKTSKVTNMVRMFLECSSLIRLDLSNFGTSNVTEIDNMFCGCSSLTNLDLSSFDTSKLEEGYGGFFKNCSSLRKIYVKSNWKQVGAYYNDMFSGCINLEGGKGTKIGKNWYGYDDKGNPLYYNCEDGLNAAHIDGGKDWPGLFTAK